MAQAIQQLVTLEYEQCCNCGVPFAFPDWMMRRLREKGGSFFCPNGHSQHYVETENTRLRKQLDEQIRVATEQAERARVAELAEGERRKELERLKKDKLRQMAVEATAPGTPLLPAAEQKPKSRPGRYSTLSLPPQPLPTRSMPPETRSRTSRTPAAPP